jgi:hypothetical protein
MVVLASIVIQLEPRFVRHTPSITEGLQLSISLVVDFSLLSLMRSVAPQLAQTE